MTITSPFSDKAANSHPLSRQLEPAIDVHPLSDCNLLPEAIEYLGGLGLLAPTFGKSSKTHPDLLANRIRQQIIRVGAHLDDETLGLVDGILSEFGRCLMMAPPSNDKPHATAVRLLKSLYHCRTPRQMIQQARDIQSFCLTHF